MLMAQRACRTGIVTRVTDRVTALMERQGRQSPINSLELDDPMRSAVIFHIILDTDSDYL